MTIGQIKEVIAANLHKSVTDYVKGSGATEINLLNLALNNARKVAEKFHDFSICRKRGHFSYSGNAIDWRSPTWFSGTGTARKIKFWYERVSGTTSDGAYGGVDRTIKALTQEQLAKLYARKDYEVAPLETTQRYLAEYDPAWGTDPLLGQTYVIIEGYNFYLHPSSTATRTIIADAFYWWPDWSSDDTTDWWTDYGTEFLILQAMNEANRLSQTFVGNVEGNLPPPLKEAARALGELVQLDKDSTESSITIEDL